MTLRLLPCVTPYIHAVSTDEYCAGFRVGGDRLTQAVSQLVLMGCVLNDGDDQLIAIAKALDSCVRRSVSVYIQVNNDT